VVLGLLELWGVDGDCEVGLVVDAGLAALEGFRGLRGEVETRSWETLGSQEKKAKMALTWRVWMW
jgi:hypothetical protein